MYGELGAVRGLVDLSLEHALDEAEAFLASLDYSILRRTSTTLTAQRRSSEESAGEVVPNLTVVVMPQPEGGVQITIRGNDFEGVQARQSERIGWSESLPRKAEEEAGAPTDEQDGIQTPEVELPPPPTVESLRYQRLPLLPRFRCRHSLLPLQLHPRLQGGSPRCGAVRNSPSVAVLSCLYCSS